MEYCFWLMRCQHRDMMLRLQEQIKNASNFVKEENLEEAISE